MSEENETPAVAEAPALPQIGSAERPFAERLPRNSKRDRILLALGDPGTGYMALAALYMQAGKYLPRAARYYPTAPGFCDVEGRRLPIEEATHVGWTLDIPALDPSCAGESHGGCYMFNTEPHRTTCRAACRLVASRCA